MNNEEILAKADKIQKEIEEEVSIYVPLAWGISYHPDSIEKLQGIIVFYEDRIMLWMKLLPGSTEAARKIFIELIECATLEIKGTQGVLAMLRSGK
jgi:hypothetical protein